MGWGGGSLNQKIFARKRAIPKSRSAPPRGRGLRPPRPRGGRPARNSNLNLGLVTILSIQSHIEAIRGKASSRLMIS